MKKLASLFLVTLLLVGALTACGGSEGGAVSTDGSTSMEKVIGSLGEAFMNANDGVTFTYNPTGSGTGITAVSEGRCDIGLSSRELKDSESGLTATVLAYDGIAVIVNPENPISDLSIEQIAAIYTGEITDWAEVGGNSGEIVLIGREAGSGTRDGFESVTDTEGECKYRQELTSTGDVITTVAQNPSAVGYASVASVKDIVKMLTVGGIAPTEAAIKDGSYAIRRPFILVTKEGTALGETAQKFFDYALSEEAKAIITAAGAVPAN